MAWFLVPGVGLMQEPAASGWFLAPNGLIYFQIASASYTPRLMLLGVG